MQPYSEYPAEKLSANSIFLEPLRIWSARCGTHDCPVWKTDIDFLDFPAHVISRMMLVELDGADDLGWYRFCGTGLITYSGIDLTGRRLCQLEGSQTNAENVIGQMKHVIDQRRPSVFIYEYIFNDPHDRRYCEATLRLPLVSENADIGFILSIDHYASTIEELFDAVAPEDD